MLRLTSEIIGSSIRTADRQTGLVRDVYFTTTDWVVRLFEIQTGTKRLFVDSRSLQSPVDGSEGFVTELTEEQIEKANVQPNAEWACFAATRKKSIIAEDGVAGVISDWVIDFPTRRVPYFVAEVERGSNYRQVILPTHWIEQSAEPKDRFYADLNREEAFYGIRFEPDEGISRDTQQHLFRNYGAAIVPERTQSPAAAA